MGCNTETRGVRAPRPHKPADEWHGSPNPCRRVHGSGDPCHYGDPPLVLRPIRAIVGDVKFLSAHPKPAQPPHLRRAWLFDALLVLLVALGLAVVSLGTYRL